MGCKSSIDVLQKANLENTPKFTMAGIKTRAKVIDVYDGDTITIAFPFAGGIFQKRCRIYGVDCAEIKTKNINEKALGLEAKQYICNITLGKIVNVEFDKNEDKYGRLLAIVIIDGNRLDKLLIQKGYGYEYFGEKKKIFGEW